MKDETIKLGESRIYALPNGGYLRVCSMLDDEMPYGYDLFGSDRALIDGGVFGDFIMTTPRKHQTMDTFGYLYDKLGNDAHGTSAGFISDHFAVYTEVRLGTEISYEEYWGKNAK